MTHSYQYVPFPRSRLATLDVYSIAAKKHHVCALLEFDVTESRHNLSTLRKGGMNISFNAWLIKAISLSLEKYPDAASFLHSKREKIIFRDHNFSFLVEKQLDGNRVPLPLVLEKVNAKSAEEISQEIENAKGIAVSNKDIVLEKRSRLYERIYYRLPGLLRRRVWKYFLSHPKTAFHKMGNVSITSPGTAGRINGWFIHKSVHPLSFGIGSVIRKPWVVKDIVEVREILNMTILIDHDVVDGAPMVRFLKELTRNIENEVKKNQHEKIR